VSEIRNCPTHGDYPAPERWSRCPTCSRDREEQEREQQRKAQEVRQRQLRDHYLRLSGIEGRYQAATLDSFETEGPMQAQVLASCLEYVEAFPPADGRGLFLIGPPGTGKTHLGCAMVRHLIEHRTEPASIATVQAIVRRLRATWRKGAAETEEEAIEFYARDALLVLDEVGATFGTEAERLQLFEVLDRRYIRRRPTVVLSNLPPQDLKAALGDRAYDRLREGARVLAMQWASHRGRVSAE
jgi:DNA replication protein DnaC